MGVYIKGIQMPKNCDVCFMHDSCEYSMPLGKRVTDCPLVEVPPHGRLIDADEFFRIFPELISYEFAAPTIIPAEDGTE